MDAKVYVDATSQGQRAFIAQNVISYAEAKSMLRS